MTDQTLDQLRWFHGQTFHVPYLCDVCFCLERIDALTDELNTTRARLLSCPRCRQFSDGGWNSEFHHWSTCPSRKIESVTSKNDQDMATKCAIDYLEMRNQCEKVIQTNDMYKAKIDALTMALEEVKELLPEKPHVDFPWHSAILEVIDDTLSPAAGEGKEKS